MKILYLILLLPETHYYCFSVILCCYKLNEITFFKKLQQIHFQDYKKDTIKNMKLILPRTLHNSVQYST